MCRLFSRQGNNIVVAVGPTRGHITQVATQRSMTLDADRRPARSPVICRHELHHHWLGSEPSMMARPPSQEIRKADSWIEDFQSRSCRSHMAHKRTPAALGDRTEVSLGGTRCYIPPAPSTRAGPTDRCNRPSTGRTENALELMLGNHRKYFLGSRQGSRPF